MRIGLSIYPDTYSKIHIYTKRDRQACNVYIQGFFLQGHADAAVTASVEYLHKCAIRLVQEREGKSNLEKLQFSNPHGEEVVQWLSQHSLSHLASTFVRNKLNSLRKVSRMSREDVSRVHQEFCANTAVGDASVDSAQVGGLVSLVTAVQSLEDDPRAKTLNERLRNFRDPTVSGLNLIGAQNQLEVVMAKKKWLAMFIFFFTLQTIFY